MTQELRITKMEMLEPEWYKLHVDLYNLGISYDEYEKSGYVHVCDVSKFDPVESVKDFSLT